MWLEIRLIDEWLWTKLALESSKKIELSKSILNECWMLYAYSFGEIWVFLTLQNDFCRIMASYTLCSIHSSCSTCAQISLTASPHINPEAQTSQAKIHTTPDDFGFWQFYSHSCFVFLIAMASWDLKLLIRNWVSRPENRKKIHHTMLEGWENCVRKWFLKMYTSNDRFSEENGQAFRFH